MSEDTKTGKTTKTLGKKVETKDIAFESLQNKFIHIKVGSGEHPATSKDIEDIRNQLSEVFDNNKINCILFVTHHAVDIGAVL